MELVHRTQKNYGFILSEKFPQKIQMLLIPQSLLHSIIKIKVKTKFPGRWRRNQNIDECTGLSKKKRVVMGK